MNNIYAKIENGVVVPMHRDFPTWRQLDRRRLYTCSRLRVGVSHLHDGTDFTAPPDRYGDCR